MEPSSTLLVVGLLLYYFGLWWLFGPRLEKRQAYTSRRILQRAKAAGRSSPMSTKLSQSGAG